MKNIIVIGNGKMAIDCCRLLLDRPQARLSLTIYDPRRATPTARISRFCESHGIPALPTRNPNRPEIVDRIRAIAPDFIFNINSFRIIKEPLLSLSGSGIVNFHNGPLPLFGGVNIPSWAIIKGLREQGVTWHLIDAGIDTGDILAQRRFPISADETAISLTFKCIVEGTRLFAEILDGVLEGRLKGTPQTGESSYYSLKDIPNDGYVDFGWPVERIDRFVRGLDFRPFSNPFTYAKVRFHDRTFIVNEVAVRRDAGAADPGRVIAVDDGTLEVGAADGVVAIVAAMAEPEQEISICELVSRHGISVGEVLAPSLGSLRG